jgi:hypothetical protein
MRIVLGSAATLRYPAPLRPCLHIHVQSFGRFDEILYLVEKTSVLTLTDSRPLPLPCGKSIQTTAWTWRT